MSEDFLTRFSELTKTLLIVSEQDKVQIDQILFNYDPNITPPPEAIEVLTQSKNERTLDDLEYDKTTKIGVIPITGMLVDRYDPFLDWYVGITAYETVLEDAKAMLEAGAETIVQHVDSGGGQAYNMLSSATELRNMVDQYGAKLITYNDGVMASAAYGVGSVSHEVYAHPDAETGSVGVVISLTDYSALYKQAGIKRIWITAGEGKVPYNEDGSFSKSFLENLQEKVDSLYERFTSHVSSYRNISQESMKELGANVYSTDKAIEAGLVDKAMTREEFVSYIKELSNKENKATMKGLFTSKQKDTQMSAKPEGQAIDLETIKAEFATEMETKLADLKTQWESEKQLELSAKDQEIADLKAKMDEFNKAQAEAKQEKRLAELSALVGDEPAKKQMEALANVDDAVFAAFVGALQLGVQAKKEADPMFTELGDEGKDVSAEDDFQAKIKAEAARVAKKYKKSE